MNKNFRYSSIMTFILLIFFFVSSLQWVKASGTIYIRSDGLVFPSTAPILREGNVYTLTDNINDSIVIQRNNIMLDGNGIYMLTGPGDYESTGIEINGRYNVTVKNFKGIEDFGYGVLLNQSSNVIISRNTLTSNNMGGIYVSDTQNASIYTNNMTLNNNYDIKLHGSSYNEIFENNARRILLEYSSNNNSVYENKILVSGQEGVGLVWSADDNRIYNNHITGGLYGVHAIYSSSQKIWGNNISNTRYGLHLSDSSNNVVYNNYVKNTTTAIFLDTSSENTIYNNNFLEFENDAFVFDSQLNLWDIGYPIGGNYWSNYTGMDLNFDGIGDSPHTLDTENSDNYPLMGLFHSFNTSLGNPVEAVSNSTIEHFEYFSFNNTIRMHVSNMTKNQTVGFVRINIPHDLMSEPYNITIEGVNPLYWNYTLYDNGTHRWIYFEYEHSTLEIIIIPEPLLLVLPLLMLATSLATWVYKKKNKILTY